jgi:hypothetical protein
MKVREVVSMLVRSNSDISRVDMIELVNRIHSTMFAKRTLYNRAFSSVTGGDPKIEIVGTETVVEDAETIDRVYSHDYSCPVKGITVVGNTVYSTNQHVGKEYNIRYYLKTPELLSEEDDILVPEEDIDILMLGVNAWLEFVEHGSNESYTFWKERTLKPWQWKLDRQYKWHGGIGQ